MTPLGANQAVQGLLDAIPDMRGVKVIGQFDSLPTAGDQAPFVRAS